MWGKTNSIERFVTHKQAAFHIQNEIRTVEKIEAIVDKGTVEVQAQN